MAAQSPPRCAKVFGWPCPGSTAHDSPVPGFLTGSSTCSASPGRQSSNCWSSTASIPGIDTADRSGRSSSRWEHDSAVHYASISSEGHYASFSSERAEKSSPKKWAWAWQREWQRKRAWQRAREWTWAWQREWTWIGVSMSMVG